MSFASLKFKPHRAGGIRAFVDFPNWWSVSVWRSPHSYGGSEGLYELAVKRAGIHYNNPVACGDVRGWLTEDEVTALMAEVAAFPVNGVFAKDYSLSADDDED